VNSSWSSAPEPAQPDDVCSTREDSATTARQENQGGLEMFPGFPRPRGRVVQT